MSHAFLRILNLAFPSVNFFKSLYSLKQRLYLSNSILFLNFYRTNFLNVKKYYFLSLFSLHRNFRKKEIKKVKSISSPVQILKLYFLKGKLNPKIKFVLFEGTLRSNHVRVFLPRHQTLYLCRTPNMYKHGVHVHQTWSDFVLL